MLKLGTKMISNSAATNAPTKNTMLRIISPILTFLAHPTPAAPLHAAKTSGPSVRKARMLIDTNPRPFRGTPFVSKGAWGLAIL